MTRSIYLALFLLVALIPIPSVTRAQQAPILQYSAKIICGKADGRVAAPGQYFTAVNIHNPNSQAVGFRWKIAVAIPGGKPGPVSQFFDARLGPDEAIEIDCPEIFERVFFDGEFVKGFVVIESPVELDVVVVYTAAGGDGAVTTLDVERVAARRQGADQPDLVVQSIDRVEIIAGSLNLRVTYTVANIGSASAGATMTRVQSDNGVPLEMTTPALAPGAAVTLTTTVAQRANCFDPDCTVCATADATNLEAESNETNNTTCTTIPG